MSDGPAAIPARHRARRQALLFSLIAALGGFLFGFATAVVNGAVGALRAHFAASSPAIGLAVAATLIGGAVGAWFAGGLADRYGRRRMMFVAAVLFLVSAIGAGAAPNLVIFAAWRFVGGLGVGIASVVAPAYIAEIAPAAERGRLGSLQQLAIASGIFLALLSDFIIAQIAGGAGEEFLFGAPAWRWMFWVQAIPAVLYGLLLFRIPPSPRYLVAKGRDAQAEAVLQSVLGAEAASAELTDIEHALAAESQPRLADLRAHGTGLLPIVWVGIGLALFQQLSGINVIFYYSAVLWDSVGFSESASLAITAFTGLTSIVTTLFAIATVDRVGRKPLLLAGSAGMAIMLGILAVIFGTAPTDAAGQPDLGSVTGSVALVAANSFVFCFGFSWGPVVWVLLGEMFPDNIRAVAISVAAAAHWLANVLVAATFPWLADVGLGLAYGLYTAAAILSFPFVLRFVSETRGKDLDQMGRG